MKSFNAFIFSFAILLAISCSNNSGKLPYDETTTRGDIKVAADDSYHLLMDAQKDAFMGIYNYAKVEVIYGAETDVVQLLLNDSIRFAVISRELTEQENNVLKSQNIFPKTHKIAYDALAFITSKSMSDSLITFKKIKDLFTSNDTMPKWSMLSNQKEIKDMNIKIVFDDPKSGNARFLKETFKLEKLPSFCYALNSNQEVINYVNKNENAIGIIGVNWISDPADSVSNSFLKSVRVLSISAQDDEEGVNGYYKPFQGFIATKQYPFSRPVFMVIREPFTGLGTGFGSFISGDKGQRIVRLSGLLPANMPVRLVETR